MSNYHISPCLGASSGIGAATAIEFAKYDVRLALTARNEANLLKTIEKCKEQGLSEDKVCTCTLYNVTNLLTS